MWTRLWRQCGRASGAIVIVMHLEWGLTGMREGGRLAEAVVVVDVLSFSTAVVLAAEREVEVYPHRAMDAYAPKVAARVGAHVAEERLSWFTGLPTGDKVVLPSLQGGTLCLEAAATGATVVAGCIRNASAIAAWMAARQGRIVVVAAGDQWRDGSPRWAVEDLLGAGAIFAGLPEDAISAEAQVAAAAFLRSRDRLPEILRACTSGRMAHDVHLAAAVDASPVVPVLVDGVFRKA